MALAAMALSTTQALAQPADPDAGKIDQTSQVLRPCIDTALRIDAPNWVCTPSGLTIQNTSGVGFVPIAPTVAPSTERTPGITQDDHDNWCETGSACHRIVSNYTQETKGNVAYGNQDGLIGTYDVILRTDLVGRQAQWRQSLILDTGPAIQFNEVWVNCWEETTMTPGINCGNHYAGAPVVNGVSPYFNSQLLFGNRLNNSDEYYGAVTARFTPSGYSQYVMGMVETPRFNCYGSTDNCYFP
ncbi:hypothetical protein [Goodfellowiella coeruleoviolacea]|uniref:hypothetical protein n=1 Tax=Goodfellowiella coeruleoviolacea TaxID=334858 RepID=UPI0020A241EE|nr:hypothetical protein [Goodfellowiella coeruleoviolacea]